MSHRFEKKEIPEDAKYVEEICACGAKRRRYASGAWAYYDEHGAVTPFNRSICTREPGPIQKPRPATPKKIERTPKEKPTPRRPSQQFIPGGTIFDVSPEKKAERIAERENMTCGRLAPAAAPVVALQNLTSAEAQMKDAYVIINLLYADLVAAGLWTRGRQMAGRLLYSAGYTETLKVLEK